MCPPSENIQKRRTDKSSARRPTFEGQRETSRRYTVNTGSDDDVEPALLQEPVTPHPESLFFFPLAIRLFRSPHTVKSVIIHICATRKLCVCVCVYVRHVPRCSLTNLSKERFLTRDTKEKIDSLADSRSPPNCR